MEEEEEEEEEDECLPFCIATLVYISGLSHRLVRGDKHRKSRGSQYFPQGCTEAIRLSDYHFLKEKSCFLNYTLADPVSFDPKQKETPYG